MARKPIGTARQVPLNSQVDPADRATFRWRATADGLTQAAFFHQLIQKDTAWRLASGLVLPENQS